MLLDLFTPRIALHRGVRETYSTSDYFFRRDAIVQIGGPSLIACWKSKGHGAASVASEICAHCSCSFRKSAITRYS